MQTLEEEAGGLRSRAEEAEETLQIAFRSLADERRALRSRTDPMEGSFSHSGACRGGREVEEKGREVEERVERQVRVLQEALLDKEVLLSEGRERDLEVRSALAAAVAAARLMEERRGAAEAQVGAWRVGGFGIEGLV